MSSRPRSIGNWSRSTPETTSRKNAEFGGGVGVPFDLPADPVRLELGQDVVEALVGDLHLVERLRGREARGRALLGPSHRRASRRAKGGEPDRRPRRFAALVAALGIGALLGLRDRLGGEDAVAEREPALDRHIHQRPRQFARDDLEMKGLAADDAAERDRAVVRPARRFRRVEGDRHAGGNLQRAGHADEIVGRARRPRSRGSRRRAASAPIAS